MRNFKNNIDRLVSKVLNEEIENKVKQISEEMGEWTEIEVDEQQLKGGQKFIAKQAEPKDKITGADFKKLRDKKETKETEEIDEFYFYDDEDQSVPGDLEEIPQASPGPGWGGCIDLSLSFFFCWAFPEQIQP